MSINEPEELAGMHAAGTVVRFMLEAMRSEVRPGITTAELDRKNQRERDEAARSTIRTSLGLWISWGELHQSQRGSGPRHSRQTRAAARRPDQARCHHRERWVYGGRCGYNSSRRSNGRSAEIWWGVCGARLGQGARAGFRVWEIGRAVEREVRRSGFSVIRDLTGHGIGRTIHEEPRMPNYPEAQANQILTEGLVITVEPIIAAGYSGIRRGGWMDGGHCRS